MFSFPLFLLNFVITLYVISHYSWVHALAAIMYINRFSVYEQQELNSPTPPNSVLNFVLTLCMHFSILASPNSFSWIISLIVGLPKEIEEEMDSDISNQDNEIHFKTAPSPEW